MSILAELRSRFATALEPLTDHGADYLAMVRPAQDERFGDFQANCAMPLAKQLQDNPQSVAQQIVDNLKCDDLCEPPEIAGPGFINLRLRRSWIENALNTACGDQRLGVEPVDQPRCFVVDYSSPNVAKPMHVGHLRSTVIGNAVVRTLRFLGHRVIADNHIGDWGTQFGMIIFGYKHFLDPAAYQQDPVAELARLYRLVSQLSEYQESVQQLPTAQQRLSDLKQQLQQAEAEQTADKSLKKKKKQLRGDIAACQESVANHESRIAAVHNEEQLSIRADEHPEIAQSARRETARLHAGDAENHKLWDEFLPQCRTALESVYNRLNIEFDVTLGESHYQPMLANVVSSLEQKQMARESDGAICIFIDDNEAPFIIRKSDGAYTYATTDLATIQYRVEELQADVILYVVDSRQAEHFLLLFETARLWGYDQTDFRHVSFGTVMGDDRRPFKTRSGDNVGLESLIEESVERARQIVDQTSEDRPAADLDPVARARIADIVGIGGIKYADLRHNRDSDYVFSWDKMLATTGDTAAYIQYAYARICGIFRKGGYDREQIRHSETRLMIAEPAERSLAVQLARFDDTLLAVVEEFRPNILTEYLFTTADKFSSFFRDCHVLKADSESVRASRLKLCDLTAAILHQGLQLLGIETADQM